MWMQRDSTGTKLFGGGGRRACAPCHGAHISALTVVGAVGCGGSAACGSSQHARGTISREELKGKRHQARASSPRSKARLPLGPSSPVFTGTHVYTVYGHIPRRSPCCSLRLTRETGVLHDAIM
jgi:hypothetical protein